MTVKLNGAGHAHAHSLVAAGKVDKDSPWSLSADEENKMLGPKGDDWAAYSAMHLGVDDAEDEKTKAHYKYPFGKSGKVYRSAIIAIRQRAGQQDAKDIFDAAGDLLNNIDGPDADDDDKSSLAPLRAYRFAAELRAAPWALRVEALDVVATASDDKVAARPMTGRGATVGSIRVLPLYGVLTQNGYFDGGDTSTDQFGAALADAVNDDSVAAILVDINSPGGSVYGTGELADAVYAARKVKPVIGVANSLAASAAYWIGSQCSEFYCTPGGEVGSIGVYTAHSDISGLLANMGVKMTLISAGKFKTQGNPFGPLDDDALATIQGSVDNYYSAFTSAVARGRNTQIANVRDGMGQGKVLSAKDALAAGMIDGVATRATVINGLVKKIKGAKGTVAECAEWVEPAAEQVAAPITPSVTRIARAKREIDILG